MEENMPNPSTENEVELCLQVIIYTEPKYKHELIALGQRTKKPPKLLNSTAARSSCTIFRVPQKIKELHPTSFQPGLVSIGPYYHGEEHLQMMEEHKCRILGLILSRLQHLDVVLDDFFKAIEIQEKQIRDCYSEKIDKYTSGELISMMVLDGCFIIELLCVVGTIVVPESDDPIFNMPWMLSSMTRDLLMLENQIPFFVLRTLYALCVADHFEEVPSLQELILTLINYSLPRYRDVSKLCEKYKDRNGEHILDLYRSTFIPERDNDHAAGDQEKTIWSRCCCCLPVRSSPKHKETSVRNDSFQSLSKEETTNAGDSNISSSPKEMTIRINSLQSLSRKEDITTNQGNSGDNLSENEETTEAKESFRLIDQPAEEPRGVGNKFKKWLIHPVKKLCGVLGIQFKEKADTDEELLEFIQPVEKLLQAGIKFKKREGTDSFLDIDFSHGALRIPLLVTGETMSTLILNCIAFEQCYKHRSKHFTSYFNFMGYLINTTFDAGYLREKKIIENFFGTDQELVNFFNEVGKNVPYYFKDDYLMKVAQKVEIYYRNVWHVRWAEFKYKYCGSVWICLSASAALFVIILTTVQTFYAVYGYHKPNN